MRDRKKDDIGIHNRAWKKESEREVRCTRLTSAASCVGDASYAFSHGIRRSAEKALQEM